MVTKAPALIAVVVVLVSVAIAEKPLPEPDSPQVVVFTGGRWTNARTIEDKGGAVVYMDLSGNLISAPKQIVDWGATNSVNVALAEFDRACSSRAPYARELFKLEGVAETVFMKVANGHNRSCLLRLQEAKKTMARRDLARSRSPAARTPPPTPSQDEIAETRSYYTAPVSSYTPRVVTPTPATTTGSTSASSSATSLKYRVVKTESYSAWIGRRFEDGAKVHVIPEGWDRVRDIAKEVAKRKANRGVVVFFWKNASDIGMQPAVFGVELIDGRISEILVDQR